MDCQHAKGSGARNAQRDVTRCLICIGAIDARFLLADDDDDFFLLVATGSDNTSTPQQSATGTASVKLPLSRSGQLAFFFCIRNVIHHN